MIVAAGKGNVRFGVVISVDVEGGQSQQVGYGNARGQGLLAELSRVEGGIDLLRLGQGSQFLQGVGPFVAQGYGVIFIIYQAAAGDYQYGLIFTFPLEGAAAEQQHGQKQQYGGQSP